MQILLVEISLIGIGFVSVWQVIDQHRYTGCLWQSKSKQPYCFTGDSNPLLRFHLPKALCERKIAFTLNPLLVAAIEMRKTVLTRARQLLNLEEMVLPLSSQH